MPLDAITISALAAELREKLEGAKIDKVRSEEHTSELQSQNIVHLVCRLLLEIGRASCRERV